jgi:N-dimethylarginine dimethylaminohydrolase
MGATYLMSYPGPDWRIRGGENFRSESRAATNPRAALREWLRLCDAISAAGGRILVMPPATVDGEPLTGMIYTANAGQLFHLGDRWLFLVSKMKVAHRQREHERIAAFLGEAGLEVRAAEHVWEGQADVQQVTGNRFIATWGVRSEQGSVEEVRRLLPAGAKLCELRLREPFFHGDTCLDAIASRDGHTLLLAHAGGFADDPTGTLRGFLGERVDLLPVDREDALGYACNALCVNGTVLAPTGLSTALRGTLVRRGYTVEELELSELFGKGGGGPRCLANELRGLTVNPGAPSYASLRAELHAKLEEYPEAT